MAITISDNEAATFNLTYTGDLWWYSVVYNNLFIPSRYSYVKVNGEIQQATQVLQQRFDGPLVNPTIDVTIHEKDLAILHPGNGRRLCVIAFYSKTNGFSFEYLDIYAERNTLKGALRWIGVSTLGGFLKYENVSAEASRAKIMWTNGGVSTVNITPASGLVWVPTPSATTGGSFDEGFDEGFDIDLGQFSTLSAHKPYAIHLQTTTGGDFQLTFGPNILVFDTDELVWQTTEVDLESPNIIIGTNVVQYELDTVPTALMPWPLPPRIDRTADGFKPFFDAFEAGFDLNPEGITDELNPSKASKRYLDVFGELFGVAAQPGESTATKRTRLLNLLTAGKDTPTTMQALLETILDVKVTILDPNDDSSIPLGRFVVTLDAVPEIGVLATLLTIRQMRSAGRVPDIVILTDPTADIAAISYKFTAQYTVKVDITQEAYLAQTPVRFNGEKKFDGSWQFGRGTFANIRVR